MYTHTHIYIYMYTHTHTRVLRKWQAFCNPLSRPGWFSDPGQTTTL